ncbi:hypothetical protein BBJ28_00009902 [Nothophytophthora sp. Chile5]|nr:hypothetical protein BBJ28_00009902 [Nothophytophthora sp. Chile5]
MQKAKDLLSDASFWVDAGVVLQLVHPITEALAASESDLTWVSAVYDEFNKLERNKVYVNELDGSVNLRDIQREILELIVSRRKLLISPSMRSGYLLDHRMSPKGFAENEHNTAIIEAVRITRLHGIGDENNVHAFQSEVTRFVRFKYEFAQTYNDGDVYVNFQGNHYLSFRTTMRRSASTEAIMKAGEGDTRDGDARGGDGDGIATLLMAALAMAGAGQLEDQPVVV